MRLPVHHLLVAAVFAGLTSLWATQGAAQCLLCDQPPTAADGISRSAAGDSSPDDQPLRVDILADLDFARLVAGQAGGRVRIDPRHGGTAIDGDVRAAAGMAFSGRVQIVGTPGRMVRIDLPDAATLSTATGGVVRLSGITTGQAPLLRLGPDGRLEVPFGGQLEVSGRADGDFRGRIAVTVSYE